MTENTEPSQTPDATQTEALQLADQQPISVPPAPAPQHSGGRHTRTILEVVGGVVAVGLILVAGVLGFVVGHVTGSDGDRGRTMSIDLRGGHSGPEAFGPLGGGQQGDGQGRDMMPGRGEGMMPGQGEGMMPGQALPTTPQQ